MDHTEGTAPRGAAGSRGRAGHQVGEREQRLEEREQQVDEREREADEREREADEREREADEREERLEDYAARLRQQSVELRAQAKSIRERAGQAVEQAKAVLEASEDRSRHAEATLNRAYARVTREGANAARAAQRGEPRPARQPVDLTEVADRVSALRKRTAAAAAQLATSEEGVARLHEELASQEPGNPGYEHVAREAREMARWAREAERKYSSS